MDTSKVTRLHVLDYRDGKEHSNFYGVQVSVDLQDDGQTLKVFVKDHPTVSAEDVWPIIADGLKDFFR